MTTFDFSPLFRTSVGYDRLASLLNSANRLEQGAGFPPYNIEKAGDDHYRITMAVAGFSEDDLTIEARSNVLSVAGAKPEESTEEKREFLHRGIASRAFERRFQLADHVVVKGASLENGLLHVDLVREVPEALKPRRIPIGATAGARPAQVLALAPDHLLIIGQVVLLLGQAEGNLIDVRPQPFSIEAIDTGVEFADRLYIRLKLDRQGE